MVKRIIPAVFVLLAVLCSAALADKIHLKSGEVLSGKIKERKDRLDLIVSLDEDSQWCAGKDDVVLWNDGTGTCISRQDIEKIEKEIKEPQGIALLAKDDRWGAAKDGYRTQLIPLSRDYVVGKPMRFGLVLTNVSSSLKWYDDQAIHHNTLLIKDSDGREVYYKQGSFQTLGADKPIDTGESAVLFENRDIAAQYKMATPGCYSIQFRGGDFGCYPGPPLPPSNVIEFTVKEGIPYRDDVVLESLLTILPDDHWRVSTVAGEPRDGISGTAWGFAIERPARLKADCIVVGLVLTDMPVEEDGHISGRFGIHPHHFCGSNALGNFYVNIPPRAKKLWPRIREDIAEALKLKKP